MQVKRQRISFYVGVFFWLILFGVRAILGEIYPDSKSLSILGPVILLAILIGVIIMNKYLVRDDMIWFREADNIFAKVIAYVAIFPIGLLILFGYFTTNENLVFIINIVSASFLILVSLVGLIYFGIIAFKKPKNPFPPPNDIIDADFREKD